LGSAVRIQTGGKEPIEVLAVDALQDRLTGLVNLAVSVRRVSDDWVLDWNDDTFRAAPTRQWELLTEIDATLSPGEYRLDNASHDKGLDTSAFTNAVADDVYRIIVVQQGTPQNAANFPQHGEIKVGDWLDFIDEAISAQATPAEVKAEMVALGLDHLISVNPGVVPPAANTYIRQILDKLDAAAAADANRYWVQQSWSYSQADGKVVGQVWVEAGNLVVAAPASCSVTWYDDSGTALWTEAGVGPDAQGVFRIEKTGPGLTSNRSYYSIASVAITGYGTVKGAKGQFTIG
jgi:hypothetical protein